MQQVRLFALTDSAAFPEWLREAQALCSDAEPGRVAVVLRDRQLSVKERYTLGQDLRRITKETGQLLLVSDRVDLALALSADGVHLPARGLSPGDCRKIWKGHISRSSHEIGRLTPADWEALDGLLISPVAAPRKGRLPLGSEGLSEAIGQVHRSAPQLPVFALGGVTGENCASFLRAGAAGAAAIGAAWDPQARRELLSALGILSGK